MKNILSNDRCARHTRGQIITLRFNLISKSGQWDHLHTCASEPRNTSLLRAGKSTAPSAAAPSRWPSMQDEVATAGAPTR
ncbi:hypothetical protein GCM10010844_34360 [Deinococcus radiotolerans]|uniref:Uncharacterized protein n=1 Tax=Deinococcus radiotolerans TaxID=1309407 RepID=A0ABQ2FNY4_9DEIO|nr:hypothetical protein GCM10010844_34360 [Deinococcus radiotolerans]